jgi:hypothetical protein
MIGKLVRNSCFVGAALAAIVATPSFAAPGAALPAMSSAVEQVSFWAEPFPYGYRYRSSSCVRYVKVATSRGMRTRRIWVCR